MSKIKLVLIVAILIEVFLFKGEHFTSFCIWAGEFLGGHLSDSIMESLNK